MSEGWHEIDHDFRYKCPQNWEKYPRFNRTFNGLLASLETTDWFILKLFEDISYSHYMCKEVQALISTKLRLRIEDNIVDNNILEIINRKSNLLKEIIKLEREKIIFLILEKSTFPLTINNIIYFINHNIFHDSELTNATPSEFLEVIK